MSPRNLNLRAPRPARKFLASAGGSLSALTEHSRHLRHVDDLLRQWLDPRLIGHCRVANIADDRLILHAESSAWATMLRYQCPRLLAGLQTQPGLERLRDVRVKIAPLAAAGAGGRPPRRYLSPKAAQLLRSVADSTDAPALEQALRRLANHEKVDN